MSKTPLNWIDLLDVTPGRDPDYPRTTSLSYGGNRWSGQSLGVVGGLVHTSLIRPKTAHDRDKLVELLNSFDYSHTCTSCGRLEAECSQNPCEAVKQDRLA